MSNKLNINHGFTLMEILIAMVIFFIVITTLFSSFKAFMVSSESVQSTIHHSDIVGTLSKRIQQDLEAIFVLQPPRYREPTFNSDPDPFRFIGSKETIGQRSVSTFQFASFAHAQTSRYTRKGIAQIAYYIRENNDHQLDLHRADRLPPYPEDAEEIRSCTDPVICRNIHQFEVLYKDQEGEEYQDWDSESEEYEFRFPDTLEIKITVRGDKDTEQIHALSFDLVPNRRIQK